MIIPTILTPNDDKKPVGALWPNASGNGTVHLSCTVIRKPTISDVGKYSSTSAYNKILRP